MILTFELKKKNRTLHGTLMLDYGNGITIKATVKMPRCLKHESKNKSVSMWKEILKPVTRSVDPFPPTVPVERQP